MVSFRLPKGYCGADYKEARLCGLVIAWGVIYMEGLCLFSPHATTCILFLLLVPIVSSELLLSSLLLPIALTPLALYVSGINRAYPETERDLVPGKCCP